MIVREAMNSIKTPSKYICTPEVTELCLYANKTKIWRQNANKIHFSCGEIYFILVLNRQFP